jgi:anti-anti-sigma factor
MEQLSILEKSGSDYMLLELTGTMNSYTLTDLQKKAYEYIKKDSLVLDLSQVIEIDSAGVGVLIGVFNAAEDDGNKLYILRPSLPVMEALEETGFFDSFNRIYSVTEVE